MDADGDNVISQADLDKFCEFYDSLGDDEYYELSQYVQDLDINKDGVINDIDYKILEEPAHPMLNWLILKANWILRELSIRRFTFTTTK